MVSNIIALIMLAFGLVMLLWGFQYRRWLLPIVSFFIGFTAAAGAAALSSDEGILSTQDTWLIAVASGSIYALMAIRFNTVGLLLIAGALGYALIVYLLLSLDIEDSTIVASAGLLGAVAFVLYAFVYRNKRWMVTAITSAAGSVSLLVGALLLFDQSSLSGFSSGSGSSTLLGNPLFWPTLVLVIAIVGYIAQSRTTAGEQRPSRTNVKASPV